MMRMTLNDPTEIKTGELYISFSLLTFRSIARPASKGHHTRMIPANLAGKSDVSGTCGGINMDGNSNIFGSIDSRKAADGKDQRVTGSRAKWEE